MNDKRALICTQYSTTETFKVRESYLNLLTPFCRYEYMEITLRFSFPFQRRHADVFIIDFQQISNIALKFPLLTLKKQMLAR